MSENPPSPLFKGEDSSSAYCIPPTNIGVWADMILLPLEKGAGGIFRADIWNGKVIQFSILLVKPDGKKYEDTEQKGHDELSCPFSCPFFCPVSMRVYEICVFDVPLMSVL